MLRLFAETDRRMDERDKRWRIEMDEMRKHMEDQDKQREDRDKRAREEWEEMQKRMEERHKEVSEALKELSKKIEELTDSWGEIPERMIASSIAKAFEKTEIKIQCTMENLQSVVSGKKMEIDILAVGKMKEQNIVLIIKVLTTLRKEEINKLNDTIKEFPNIFSEYKDYSLIGALACIKARRDSKNMAEKNGFYVLMQSKRIVKIVNSENFKPKLW